MGFRVTVTLAAFTAACLWLAGSGPVAVAQDETLRIIDLQYLESGSTSRLVVRASLPFTYRAYSEGTGTLVIETDAADTSDIAPGITIGSRFVHSITVENRRAEQDREVTAITIRYRPENRYEITPRGRRLFIDFAPADAGVPEQSTAEETATASREPDEVGEPADAPEPEAEGSHGDSTGPDSTAAPRPTDSDSLRYRLDPVVTYSLTALRVDRSRGGVEIVISTDRPMERRLYRIVPVGPPPRYVVDLHGATNNLRRGITEAVSGYFASIRTAQFDVNPYPISRVVLDIEDERWPQAFSRGNDLVLSFSVDAEAAGAGGSETARVEPVVVVSADQPRIEEPTEAEAGGATGSADVAEQEPTSVERKADAAESGETREVIYDPAPEPEPAVEPALEVEADAAEKGEAREVTSDPAPETEEAVEPALEVEADAAETGEPREVISDQAPETEEAVEPALEVEADAAETGETREVISDQAPEPEPAVEPVLEPEAEAEPESEPEADAEVGSLPFESEQASRGDAQPAIAAHSSEASASYDYVSTSGSDAAAEAEAEVATGGTTGITEPPEENLQLFSEQYPDGMRSSSAVASATHPAPVGTRPQQQSEAPQQGGEEQFDLTTERDQDFFRTREITPSERRYRGRRVNLEFESISLRALILLLGQMTDKNFIVDPSVRHLEVSLSLRDVPWDQALEIILDYYGLGSVEEDNVIRIATRQRLTQEAEERRQLALQRALSVPRRQVTRPVNYAKASDLLALIRRNLSSQGEAVVDERTNTLVITDIPSKVDEHLALLEALDIPTRQVIVEARIVETTRDFINEFGLQYGFRASATSDYGSSTGLIFPNQMTISGGGPEFSPNLLPFAVNLPASTINSSILGSFANINGSFILDAILTAAESERKVRVLSRPRISALNNDRAEIKSGIEVPYQVIQNNTVSIRWREATLRLTVTPHITSDATVILDVEVDKSSLGIQTAAGFTIQTRQATSTVLVPDGGVAVIGGVLEISENITSERTPFLHRIPLIGRLFRSRQERVQNTELLIFISPKIIG